MKRESSFQSNLIERLEYEFPGILVLKNDPNYIQGIPDLTLLYGKHWACLECKRSSTEKLRPNQSYYISLMNEMSYASFIYPENMEDVINELQQAFGS